MQLIHWFEIPVGDMACAARFYAELFGAEIPVVEQGDGQIGLLPHADGAGGALVTHQGYQPSHAGSLVYLATGADLKPWLDRALAAGGKLLMPRTSIGENGFCAWFEDPEGNRVGLHASG